LTGRAFKDTWGDLGRQKEKELKSIKWIASDESELVPTTDVELLLERPIYLFSFIQNILLIFSFVPIVYIFLDLRLLLDTLMSSNQPDVTGMM
jgi:hypothetical protein